MKKKFIATCIASLGCAVVAGSAWAQGAAGTAPASMPTGGASNLATLVNHALNTHPEVQARFHDFVSSLEDQNIATGGLRPQANAQAWYGHEWRSQTSPSPSFDWRRPGWELSLTQLLYDGSATFNEIDRFGFEKLSRYYDLRATSNALADQVTEAYLDVQRYRQMRLLAQDNYQVHQDTLGHLRERQQSGVGRGVDLEQANGRLALAQVNLMTESNNLNDVTQRFHRVVGQYPAATLDPVPPLQDGLLPTPGTTHDFEAQLRGSPTLLSKQALVQAAEAAQERATALHKPTVELRLATGRDREKTFSMGPTSNYQSTSLQVLMNYNLYRGGADEARIRQTIAQHYAAQDVRDYTCRNAQQDLSVAWNNIVRLREQLPFLREHELATSKVRTAFMQQFQIGQRTLLDLLDTENELFEARRALVNAEYDLRKYEFQWLTQANLVMPALGLAKPPHEDALPEEQNALALPDEVLQACKTPLPDTSNLAPVAAR